MRVPHCTVDGSDEKQPEWSENGTPLSTFMCARTNIRPISGHGDLNVS